MTQRIAHNRLSVDGQKYGRLTVIGEATEPGGTRRSVHVQCECGGTKTVALHNLRAGRVKSCGCIYREMAPELGKLRAKHGKAGTPIHKVWTGMLSRVRNPNDGDYKNYGARGITVDPAWESFENFYADMGDRPQGLTLDRVDNDKGYSKSNCRWATHSEQNRNKEREGKSKLGVVQMPSGNWQARILVDKDRKNLGTFSTYEEAVAARVAAEQLYWKTI